MAHMIIPPRKDQATSLGDFLDLALLPQVAAVARGRRGIPPTEAGVPTVPLLAEEGPNLATDTHELITFTSMLHAILS